MKKLICILLAALLALSFSAMAEGDPSAAVPSVTLDQITRIDGTVLPEGFVIKKLPEVETSEQVSKLYESIAVALESSVKLSDLFANTQADEDPELQAALDKMMVCEFIPLTVKGVVPEIGDVEVLLTVPGEYAPEDHVQSLLGIFMDEEVVWLPLATEVTGEQIKVIFHEAALQQLNAESEVVLVLLRDIQ